MRKIHLCKDTGLFLATEIAPKHPNAHNCKPSRITLDPSGSFAIVELSRGELVIIDPEDVVKVIGPGWWASKPSKTNVAQYALTEIKDQLGLMHRIILNAPEGMPVDHKNGDGFDNRKQNLRICTGHENSRNKPKATRRKYSSKYKGVNWQKSANKWVAAIRIDDRLRHIGVFTDETEAAMAYDKRAKEAWGEFACINFPEDP